MGVDGMERETIMALTHWHMMMLLDTVENRIEYVIKEKSIFPYHQNMPC